MFAKAYEIATKFTHPLIVVYRLYDTTVESGLGTFIVINDEGWIMTAAHNLEVSWTFQQHQQELAKANEQIAAVDANTTLKQHQRDKALKNIKRNPKWITHYVICLGATVAQFEEYHVEREHDVAIVKVDPRIISDVTGFPRFKNPNNVRVGTSVCKLGHPFYRISATYDEPTNSFNFPQNLFPIPRFPIEGIYTRNVIAGKGSDGTTDVMYLETSSPGLTGQSGGPIFDVDGNVYALQSQNATIPLGFKGTVEINGRKYDENQFINVGLGVHTATVVYLLRKYKIKFELAD
jgi:Trypsin-like peptidase domain